ncbi:MAG: elongation factor P [Planctomycetota bacterium]|jgi:elongation factor P
MGSYSTSEFKKGLKVMLEGEPWVIIESQFVKPGKGSGIYKIRCRNLLQGGVTDKTYRSGDKIESADVEEAELQYLYCNGSEWVFMHQETFEQYSIQKDNLDGKENLLVDEMVVGVTFWNGQAISVELPKFVELEVTYCEPGFKGNTSTNVMKPATLSTGHETGVPMFINIGDVVRVSTADGEYVERVTKG